MLDTTFAVRDKKLTCRGVTYTIKAAGIQNDQPYVEVEPTDPVVVNAILNHIRKCMPLPFSLDEVQKELG